MHSSMLRYMRVETNIHNTMHVGTYTQAKYTKRQNTHRLNTLQQKHASSSGTHLSLEAFNSKTASLVDAPSRVLAIQRILVVFPVPGGPYRE